MVLISTFMILLLIGITLWLWRLSQVQFTQQQIALKLKREQGQSQEQQPQRPPLSTLPPNPPPDELLDKSPVTLSRELEKSKQLQDQHISDEKADQVIIVLCQNPAGAMALLQKLMGKKYVGTARYFGTARLPKEVFAGDSHNISLILDRKSLIDELHSETFQIEDTANGKQITLDIQETDNSEQSLEVQLLAAGFSTKGEEKQRQSLSQERLEYRWNCCFQNAGDHEFSLVLKVIHPSGERSLGAIEQTVHVNHLDHLTSHQVRIAAIGTGTVALLATIANLLSTVLGIWHLH